METSRFVEITDKELIKLIGKKKENPNTKRKTVYEGELFRRTSFRPSNSELGWFKISS